MITLFAAAALAQTQDYAFPSSPADHLEYYPTAYKDHGGVDWNCGYITYPGHRGSDFGGGSFTGMDEGRDVNAAAPGVVLSTVDGEFDRCTTGDCYGGGGFGNHVRLVHADGKETVYAHLKQWSVLVAAGQWVDCGEKLGEMGSSGHSTGPHVHFQVDQTSGYAGDPFDGPCSGPPTWWVGQGVYDSVPDLTCGTYPACEEVQALTCGDVVSTANDAAGSTDTHWIHGCTDFVYSGPEIAYEVRTRLAEPVTVTITGLSADLDLFVSDTEACDGRGCVAASTNTEASDESVVWDAQPDMPYTIVADGWEGAVTGFTLTVQCEGAVTDATDPEPTDTSGTPSGTPTEVTDDTGPVSRPEVVADEGGAGCGCDTSGGLGAWPLAAVLLARRRRR